MTDDSRMVNEQLAAAKTYCDTNLVPCCKDMVAWTDTGLLPQGPLRELIELCRFAGHSAQSVARQLVTDAALRLAANNVVSGH